MRAFYIFVHFLIFPTLSLLFAPSCYAQGAANRYYVEKVVICFQKQSENLSKKMDFNDRKAGNCLNSADAANVRNEKRTKFRQWISQFYDYIDRENLPNNPEDDITAIGKYRRYLMQGGGLLAINHYLANFKTDVDTKLKVLQNYPFKLSESRYTFGPNQDLDIAVKDYLLDDYIVNYLETEEEKNQKRYQQIVAIEENYQNNYTGEEPIDYFPLPQCKDEIQSLKSALKDQKE